MDHRVSAEHTFMNAPLNLPIVLAASIASCAITCAGERDAMVAPPAPELMLDAKAAAEPSRWAFETSVAWITPNSIGDFFLLKDLSIEDNDAGGQVYSLTASYLLGELPFEFNGRRYSPRMELPLTLSVFDENNGSTFMDYNGAFAIRWVDFPWNGVVQTSFMMGVGLSYSSQIPLIDRQRYPNQDRSHLKINWPIQLTFALPDKPQHQLALFIDHQSGGHIFDRGGINCVGIGYRYAPE